LYVPGPETFVTIKGPSHGLSSLWRPSVFCILRSTRSPTCTERCLVLLL
jgi:hypothetical protein